MLARRTLAVALALAVLAGLAAGAAVPAGLPAVAVCSTQPSFDSDVIAKLTATGLYASVDQLDCRSTTPSLATLQGYPAVLVYSDSEFDDKSLLGDRLADYVDGGGKLVVATFSFDDESYNIGGRIVTGGYLPFEISSGANGGSLTLVADDPSSPLLAGVSSFSGGGSSYRANVTLTTGATLVAHWSNGTPLVAFKGSVVGLNFYPPSSDARGDFWNAATDGVRLLTNALSVMGSVSARAGYCSVAGNTNPYSGAAIAPGTFLDLALGQPGTNANYKGALPANYLQGAGISCQVPAGYVKTGEKVGYAGAGDAGIYDYYKKG